MRSWREGFFFFLFFPDVTLFVVVCLAYRIVLSTPQALSKYSVDELNDYVWYWG